jgi:hypothetical protein
LLVKLAALTVVNQLHHAIGACPSDACGGEL